MSDAFREELSTALGPNYTIDRELSGGGMSRVFVATEHGLNRTVVVKVLKPDLAADVNRDRFRREIMVVAQLQHPHIVPVLNAGQSGELLWYTMPFVEGESLRESLRQGRTMSPREVIRVLHDVLDALDYAHARGVVHRDIKPGNILRHRSHSLVTDFGVAKALSAAMPHSGTTSAGMAIGTPAYMAPEQLAADPRADHRMDLYAVGLLAYELLTGAQPFVANSPQETMAAQLTRMPTPVDEVRKDLPPALSALITRLLAKNPDERPASAAAALDELEALATPPDATASRAWSVGALTGAGAAARGRGRAIIAAAALVGAVVLAIGVFRNANTSAVVAGAPGADTGGMRRPDSLAGVGGRAAVTPTGAAAGRSVASTSVSGSGAGSGGGARPVAATTAAPAAPRTTVGGGSPAAATPATKTATKTATKSAPARVTPPATPSRRFAVPRKVALIPARWMPTRPELGPTAQAVTDSLRRAFQAAGYTLATDGELVQLLAQPAGTSLRRAAQAAGVGAVITADIVARASEVRATAVILDVWRNGHLSATEASDADKPLEVLGVVRDVARSLDRVSWRRQEDPRLVLLFNVENQTGMGALDTLGRAIGDAARAAIQELPAALVRDSAALAITDPTERRDVGVRQLAGALVAISMRSFRRDSLTLRVSVRDMSEDATFPTIELRLPVTTGAAGAAPAIAQMQELLRRVNWGPRRDR